MLQHQDHFHGSDLEKIEKIYGIRKRRDHQLQCQRQSAWDLPPFTQDSDRTYRCHYRLSGQRIHFFKTVYRRLLRL